MINPSKLELWLTDRSIYISPFSPRQRTRFVSWATISTTTICKIASTIMAGAVLTDRYKRWYHTILWTLVRLKLNLYPPSLRYKKHLCLLMISLHHTLVQKSGSELLRYVFAWATFWMLTARSCMCPFAMNLNRLQRCYKFKSISKDMALQ